MPPNKLGQNEELTSSEKNTLRAYREWVDEHGAPPSFRQLAKAAGCALATTQHHMLKFRLRGYVVEKKVTHVRLGLSAKGRKVKL